MPRFVENDYFFVSVADVEDVLDDAGESDEAGLSDFPAGAALASPFAGFCVPPPLA